MPWACRLSSWLLEINSNYTERGNFLRIEETAHGSTAFSSPFSQPSKAVWDVISRRAWDTRTYESRLMDVNPISNHSAEEPRSRARRESFYSKIIERGVLIDFAILIVLRCKPRQCGRNIFLRSITNRNYAIPAINSLESGLKSWWIKVTKLNTSHSSTLSQSQWTDSTNALKMLRKGLMLVFLKLRYHHWGPIQDEEWRSKKICNT